MSLRFQDTYITAYGYDLIGHAVDGSNNKIVWGSARTTSNNIDSLSPSDIVALGKAQFNGLYTCKGNVVSAIYSDAGSNARSVTLSCILFSDTTSDGHGSTDSLVIFAKLEGQDDSAYEVAMIARSGQGHVPEIIPADGTWQANVSFIINLHDASLQGNVIAAPDSFYTPASVFNNLANRVVTTHTENSNTTGETQTVYGNKTFKNKSTFDGDSEFNGNVEFKTDNVTTQNIKPASDGDYNLGDPENQWDAVYAYDGEFNYIYVDEMDTTLLGSSSPVSEINATSLFATSIGSASEPVSTIYATNLGDATHKVSTIYATNIGDANHPVTNIYGTIQGTIEGTAEKANKWTTARNFSVADYDQSNEGNAISVDGSSSSGYMLRLPATIKASLVGNVTGSATSAGKWTTARNFSIADYDQTNVSSTSVSVDGSTNYTLRLPQTIKASLVGNISGSAASAGKWTTSRSFVIKDSDSTNSGASVSVDGSSSSGYTLKLPSTIKASLTGNASTASKWYSSRNFSVADYDQSNTGTAQSVDGSGAVVLRLPSTIKATLAGNASTATKATQDESGNNIKSSYAATLTKSGTVSTGSSNTNYALVLKNKNSSNLSTVYISDIVANALRGYGGYNTTATTSYGSIGTIGLFAMIAAGSTWATQPRIITPTNTSGTVTSGSRLIKCAFYATKSDSTAWSVSATSGGSTYSNLKFNCILGNTSDCMTGTWVVLSGCSLDNKELSIVLAVRIY